MTDFRKYSNYRGLGQDAWRQRTSELRDITNRDFDHFIDGVPSFQRTRHFLIVPNTNSRFDEISIFNMVNKTEILNFRIRQYDGLTVARIRHNSVYRSFLEQRDRLFRVRDYAKVASKLSTGIAPHLELMARPLTAHPERRDEAVSHRPIEIRQEYTNGARVAFTSSYDSALNELL